MRRERSLYAPLPRPCKVPDDGPSITIADADTPNRDAKATQAGFVNHSTCAALGQPFYRQINGIVELKCRRAIPLRGGFGLNVQVWIGHRTDTLGISLLDGVARFCLYGTGRHAGPGVRLSRCVCSPRGRRAAGPRPDTAPRKRAIGRLLPNTLARYFARRFVIATIAVFGGIFMLLVLVDYIEMVRRTSSIPTASALMVAKTSLFRVPQLLEKLMPFCILF